MPPCDSERSVTLVDVPGALDSACRQHRHAVLREPTFAASHGDLCGVRPDDLATANDISNVISACVGAARAGPLPESGPRTLLAALPADAADAVRTLRRVLERAEAAAREERFLVLPALPRPCLPGLVPRTDRGSADRRPPHRVDGGAPRAGDRCA